MNMAQQLRAKLGVKPNGKSVEVKMDINYGYNDTHVVIILNSKVDNISLDEKQCQDMIEALTGARKAFIEHKAAKK